MKASWFLILASAALLQLRRAGGIRAGPLFDAQKRAMIERLPSIEEF